MARSKCCACGLLFGSTTAFDTHRTGSYPDNERRCMAIDEMVAKGMIVNEKGIWSSKAFDRVFSREEEKEQ